MVDQIRRFVRQLLAIVNGCSECGLYSLFTHLLRNALGTAGIELRRIGAGRIGAFARRQQLLQLVEEQPLMAFLFTKAAGSAGVAGRPDGVDQHQQRVVIAVRRDADHVKHVTGGFTFGPQALLGARVEGDQSALFGFRQRLLVHIAQH